MNLLAPRDVEIRHFHLFCGLGGGARGFNHGEARVGHLQAQFRCLGGIDVDKGAIADFTKLAGVPGTVLDLFSREQYVAFHGKQPPDGWREATPEDIQRAAQGQRPHICFGSAPCKGFSGLLSENRSKTDRYQALNQLALRGLWLALEAWKDDPVEFWLWENVPRIATRGRAVLDQMIRLLEAYGYAVAETTHDCGELGELAQSRKRFLLVARHREKVPPFLYEPQKRSLRAVGDVLGALPLPGDAAAGPMHRMRALQWRTWVRLAFVKAGSDWRSLKELRVEDGFLKDFALLPEIQWHRGSLGVNGWDEPAGTVTSTARPHNGAFSVADPRIDGHPKSVQFGVRGWDQPATTITGDMWPGCGPVSVADPRIADGRNDRLGVRPWDASAHVVQGNSHPSNGAHSVADPRMADGPRGPHFHNVYRVIRFDEPAPTVTAQTSVSSGALAVADPRAGTDWEGKGKYNVTPFDAPAGTVIAASTTGNGAFAVADPRCGFDRGRGDNYLTSRFYGVLPWDEPSGVISASAGHDNGAFSIADPRCAWSDNAHRNKLKVVGWDQEAPTVIGGTRVDSGALSVADPRCDLADIPPLPAAETRLVAIIRALDGTWHRPFTTLELAALQSLVDPGEFLELYGASDTAWRERIGNAVPSAAARAIASVMGTTLLLAWTGETFHLSATPVWVQPIAIALSVDQSRNGDLR